MRTPYMSSQQLLSEDSGSPRLERSKQLLRERRHSFSLTRVEAIWLNLPEEQADLKD